MALEPENPNTCLDVNRAEGAKWRGSGFYFFLLSVETAGAVILLAFYRLLAIDFPNYRLNPEPWGVIAGMLLIQVGYWLRVRLQPPLPQTRNIVLGHIVAFLSKISFVAVGSTFTVMFLNRFAALQEMEYPPLRALGVLITLFSLYCYTRELERLAETLQQAKPGNQSTHGI